MGDENSLQGRTQAHKHESASSTGGFLETGFTGMTNLSNGSLVYGDASEIVTELTSGNLNDVLTMGASTPAWVAPAVATSAFTLINSVTVATTQSDLTVTPVTPIDASVAQTMITFSCASASAQDIQLTVNGSSLPSYNSIGQYNQGTVTSFSATGASKWEVLGGASGTSLGSTGVILLNVQDDGAGNDYIIGSSNCFTSDRLDMLALKYTTSQSTITEINLTPKGAVDWTAGSTLSVFTLAK